MSIELFSYATASFGGTAAAVGTVDVTRHKNVCILVTGLTGETVNITWSPDNNTYSTGKVRPFDLTTGALAASSDLGNGSYRIDSAGMGWLKITKSAASENVTVRIAMSNF